MLMIALFRATLTPASRYSKLIPAGSIVAFAGARVANAPEVGVREEVARVLPEQQDASVSRNKLAVLALPELVALELGLIDVDVSRREGLNDRLHVEVFESRSHGRQLIEAIPPPPFPANLLEALIVRDRHRV
jgi:hypothetical protein